VNIEQNPCRRGPQNCGKIPPAAANAPNPVSRVNNPLTWAGAVTLSP
jgi:hypothetical protein